MDKQIRCIKIIHPLSCIRLWRLLSGFFRFIGIFVCENIENQEYGEPVDWYYKVDSKSEDSNDILESSFRVAIKEFSKQCSNSEYVLQEISELYLKYNLMAGSYGIGYFANTGNFIIYKNMLDAKSRFEVVLEQLKNLEDSNHLENIYLWFAKANCKRRINEIYTVIKTYIIVHNSTTEDPELVNLLNQEKNALRSNLNYDSFIEFSDFNEDIKKILKKDPNSYNAYAIRGLAVEFYDEYKVNSANEFKKAIRITGDACYASYLYYRIGRYCETIRYNRVNNKKDFYKKALEVDSHNYRALYKLASSEKNFEEAIKLWEKFLMLLEPLKELSSLQPIESAYLYKAYYCLGDLYRKNNQISESLSYLNQAIQIWQNEKDIPFYQWMFGENWLEYKNAQRQKLKVENCLISAIKVSCAGNRVDEYKSYNDTLNLVKSKKKIMTDK